MKQPQIDLIPLRPAVCSDVSVTLDVLVKITPPIVEPAAKRPALNLGLVMDRSGSMSARNKIDYAREAATFAVKQLQRTDRASVTLFDDVVETIVPNDFAENKPRIVDLIRSVAGAKRWLDEARQMLTAAPNTLEVSRERDALAVIENHLEQGSAMKFMKRAKYQAYQRRQSRVPDL